MRPTLPQWMYWLDTLLFVGMTLHFLWHLRWVHRLPALDSLPAPSDAKEPFVSVILAARDEEKRVEDTISRVLEQKGIRLQIIVANDRSTDKTGPILDRLAGADARIQVILIKDLPPNWLGKCHACHLASQQASGDWLLFTDADCWLHPEALARALRVAKRDAADHVTLLPGVAPRTLAAAGWHIVFTMAASDWVSRVNRNRPRAHLGVGAFNLVRADLYRKAGGHEKLRLSVVDDVKLGLLLQRTGCRTRGFLGSSDAECHWGTTLGEGIQLMEKNFFAIVDYRATLVIGLVVSMWSFWGIAFLGLISCTLPGLIAFCAMLLLAIPSFVVGRRLGFSSASALVTPFIFPLAHYALLRSMVLTLRRGGVRWRDTFYPLALLRRGNLK